jgi:anti-sigma factor RsiW
MDDTVLMAYVDGALPPQEREQVEKGIAASPELAERVALLAASQLPYRDAFAQQRLPRVPQHLKERIEQLAREHSAKRGHSSANDSTLRHHSLLPPSAPVRSLLRSGRPAPAWLAVAFIAGAFFYGAALRFLPGLGEAHAPAGSVAMRASPWVQAVVASQQL